MSLFPRRPSGPFLGAIAGAILVFLASSFIKFSEAGTVIYVLAMVGLGALAGGVYDRRLRHAPRREPEVETPSRPGRNRGLRIGALTSTLLLIVGLAIFPAGSVWGLIVPSVVVVGTGIIIGTLIDDIFDSPD
jgi:hypothetical protein